MSNDFKEETHNVLETREAQSEEELIRILTEEFNNMFTRESVEANPYLIFKMNTSLEIPVTAIYKDKRISSICTNLAIIREALGNSNSVTYDRQREVLIPKIKAQKNKIILNKIPDGEKDGLFRVIYQSPEYIQKISDKYIDNLKSYTIILRTEEQADSLNEKIKAAAHKTSTLEIHQEYEDLYLDLLQKAQDVLKHQSANPEEYNPYGYDMYYQNYNYYYGMNPYMNAYGGRMMGGQPYSYRAMNNSNQYYNNYYNNMFIRKAQDETAEADNQRGEYQGRHGRGKKDRNSKKPGQYTKTRSDHKESATKNVNEEEITRRTRVNSENFPPLMSEERAPEPIAEVKEEEPVVNLVVEKTSNVITRYDKDEFIKIFKQNGDKIKPNDRLFKLDANFVPVLNVAAKPSLEFITPTPVSSFKSPESIIRTPKVGASTPKVTASTPKVQAK